MMPVNLSVLKQRHSTGEASRRSFDLEGEATFGLEGDSVKVVPVWIPMNAVPLLARQESRLARFRCPFRHEGGWRNGFCWALITVVAVPRWGVDTVGDIRLSLLTALGLPEI